MERAIRSVFGRTSSRLDAQECSSPVAEQVRLRESARLLRLLRFSAFATRNGAFLRGRQTAGAVRSRRARPGVGMIKTVDAIHEEPVSLLSIGGRQQFIPQADRSSRRRSVVACVGDLRVGVAF